MNKWILAFDLPLNIGDRVFHFHIENAFAKLRRGWPRIAHDPVLSIAGSQFVFPHVCVAAKIHQLGCIRNARMGRYRKVILFEPGIEIDPRLFINHAAKVNVPAFWSILRVKPFG